VIRPGECGRTGYNVGARRPILCVTIPARRTDDPADRERRRQGERARRRTDIALRVAVQPGGCSGLRYALYLDDQVSEKDQAEDQFGVRIVVDKMSVPYLSEAKIDFIDSLEQTGFTIDNPVAQGGCACGHSFH
jgi:iron-sulfur cluster assembly accessory protein